jgi:hypothetical protein
MIYIRKFLLILLFAFLPFAPTSHSLAAPLLKFTNPGPGGGSDLWQITFHPTDPNTFYVGGDIEGPFKTTDGGASYTRMSNGLVENSLPNGIYASQDIEIDPQNPETVYLATWSGLYKSINGAATWTLVSPVAPFLDEPRENIATVAVSPFDRNLILTGIGIRILLKGVSV